MVNLTPPPPPLTAKQLEITPGGSAELSRTRDTDTLANVNLVPPVDNEAARTELQELGATIRPGTHTAARNRINELCRNYPHIILDFERSNRAPTMRTHLLYRTGKTCELLWRAQWNTSDAHVYDVVFTVVYRVAVCAIQCLIQENLIPAPPPPLPTRQWTTVAENFPSHFRPKEMPKLHGVSHFSLDTEGCGHTPYKDTFFQLGVWYTDGTCEVYMG